MKKILIRKGSGTLPPPPVIEEEEIEITEKDKFMWLRLPDALNVRFIKQCKRLHCGASTLARMAVVRFIEEEEAKAKALSEMKINL